MRDKNAQKGKKKDEVYTKKKRDPTFQFYPAK